MIQILFFTILTVINAHDNCINPFTFELNKEENLEFTAMMSETPIVFENKDIKNSERIQAHYCRFVNPYKEQRSFTIKANPETSTSSTKIYLYRMCASEIATEAYMKSGFEYNEYRRMNFPIITFTLDAEETVSFAVALEEKFHNGNAKVIITETVPQPPENSCLYAKSISVPFNERQYLTKNSQMTLIECNNLASPHINFNAPSYTYWYKVVGNGKKLKISTCDNFTNIDTTITVLTTCPTSPNTKLYCAGLGNDGCPLFRYATNMYIDTTVGTQYFIAVSVNPEDQTNKVYEGQYAITVDYLDESHPSICSNAKTAESLPYVHKETINHNWPATLDKCYESGNDDRAVYLKVIGTGKDIIISSCDSVNSDNYPIGVVIELLEGCKSKSMCLVSSYTPDKRHTCGANMYIEHYTEFGKEYIVRAYCDSNNMIDCPINLNIYEKGEDHSRCEIAHVIQESHFKESHNQEDMEYSIHGCSGRPEGKVLGTWYKLKLDSKKSHQHFKITVKTNAADVGGWIELPMNCGNFTCETGRSYGTIIVDLDLTYPEQYIFVYPEEGKEYVGIVVEINEVSSELHPNCEETTNYIKLPYSVIENFDSEEQELVCTNRRTETSYFKFKLDIDRRIEATTYSDETKVKTGLEITKGCRSQGGLCVAQDGTEENKSIMGSQITADLMRDTDYVLTVYSLDSTFLRVRQYRMIIAEKETPDNSYCISPVEIDTLAKRQHHSFYTKYAVPTTLSESVGKRKGGFYHIKAPNPMTVYVNTCALETSENSLIAIMKSCKQNGIGERADMRAEGIKKIITSNEERCGVYGTEYSFTLKKGEERFIFVGAQEANEVAFIELEITIVDESGIFYSLLSTIMIVVYVWASIILLGILIIYLSKKIKRAKKTKSYTAEAQKGYHLLEEFDDDEIVLDNNNENDSTVYIDEEKDNVELLEF